MRTAFILALALAPLNSLALPSSKGELQPKFEELYRFPTPNFLENLAVQSNGNILFCSLTAGALYSMDPRVENPTPSVIYKPEHLNATGAITETVPGVFVFVAANFIVEKLALVKGSAAIYQADLRGPEPLFSFVTQVPNTTLLNGIVTLENNPNLVLISDSYTGEIYRLDVAAQKIEVVYQNDRLAPFKDPSKNRVPLGVNGMRIRGNTLYLVNSARGYYASMQLTPDGRPKGRLNIIARLLPFKVQSSYDDFDIDCEGNAYLATRLNEIRKIGTDGTQEIIAGGVPGDNKTISGPTSLRFGRGSSKEERTLYGTSAGLPLDGTQLGGQIFALHL